MKMYIEEGTKVQIYSPSGELIDEYILEVGGYIIFLTIIL